MEDAVDYDEEACVGAAVEQVAVFQANLKRLCRDAAFLTFIAVTMVVVMSIGIMVAIIGGFLIIMLYIYSQIAILILLWLCCAIPLVLYSIVLNFFFRFHFDKSTVAWACWSLAFLFRALCKKPNDKRSEDDDEKKMLSKDDKKKVDKKDDDDPFKGPFLGWIGWVMLGIVIFWIPNHLTVILTSPVDIRKNFRSTFGLDSKERLLMSIIIEPWKWLFRDLLWRGVFRLLTHPKRLVPS